MKEKLQRELLHSCATVFLQCHLTPFLCMCGDWQFPHMLNTAASSFFFYFQGWRGWGGRGLDTFLKSMIASDVPDISPPPLLHVNGYGYGCVWVCVCVWINGARAFNLSVLEHGFQCYSVETTSNNFWWGDWQTSNLNFLRYVAVPCHTDTFNYSVT